MSDLVLYVKKTCPWCVSAKHYLDEKGYTYLEKDVLQDAATFAEMRKISGQGFVPTLQIGELILADFGPDELARFLQENGIQPA